MSSLMAKRKPTWSNAWKAFDHVGLLCNGPPPKRVAIYLVVRLLEFNEPSTSELLRIYNRDLGIAIDKMT